MGGPPMPHLIPKQTRAKTITFLKTSLPRFSADPQIFVVWIRCNGEIQEPCRNPGPDWVFKIRLGHGPAFLGNSQLDKEPLPDTLWSCTTSFARFFNIG
jgi:hypothetical protein